jgi:streptogramin lyase
MPRPKSFVSLRWAVAGFLSLALALPGSAVSFTHFVLPTNGLVGSIAAGPDGNIWVTDFFFNAVFQMTTAGVPLQRFTVFNMPLFPAHGMVAGPDGNLWLAALEADAIARLTLKGEVTYFTVADPVAGPTDLTVGPDGNVWFNVLYGNINDYHIGRISPSGEIVKFSVNKPAGGMTAGPDGHLWFSQGDAIGRISPQGALQEFPIPWSNAGAGQVVTGPDGNLWFTDLGRIGRVTTAGAFTSFSVPGAHGPTDLVAGPDGKLWFATGAGAQIGSMTMLGDVAMYDASTQGAVYAIAVGSDGNLWFTETAPFYAGVGRATLRSACVPTPSTLCLDDQPGDGRWQIQANFHTQQGAGSAGSGNALSLAGLGVSHGGLFGFFESANPEILVKVLDACAISNSFWVFYSATTNVGFTLTVTDTSTGLARSYTNPDLTPAPPVQDTAAFPCN